MISAEERVQKNYPVMLVGCRTYDGMVENNKQTQLDAMREGMIRAAYVLPKSELPKGMVEGSMEAYHWNNGYVTAASQKHIAILAAADRLTEKDLH
jgi:hypothetical protein